ncbi:Gfo/Idh/MocA family oxidoreductase [Dactylosporangium sp. NPDC005572]|uniref:Gfo/Idh/MocA family protein n=1 Tax=Dactylosporangium sp. NPDC005572 TaxID=3156889 RepID=UPI0033A60640
MSAPVGVGVVGAGRISSQYLDNLTRFPDLNVVMIADLLPERAAAQAAAYGVPHSGTPDEALAHPGIELIVNLTIPAAHAEVSLAALEAGKHVWSEKPFALSVEDGEKLLDAASARGLRIGCAPDTFLGAGLQSVRRAVERGDIGEPLSGLTLFEVPGPQDDHPILKTLLSRGAGPLWDMGPYYLTALTQTLGSFASVYGVGRIARPRRTPLNGPGAGIEHRVEVPTHVSFVSRFAGGQTSSSTLSWDSPHRRVGHVEIVGSEGTLSVPDPNEFTGPVRLLRRGSADWVDVPVTGPVAGRGLGALDIARAVRAGLPHRADGRLAFHVLETIAAVTASIESGTPVKVTSRAPHVEPVPEDWDPYARTL